MRDPFDIPELGSTSGLAFDWVAQELALPDDTTRHALRSAFIEHRFAGFATLAKALAKGWGPGSSWASGEAYLRSQSWRPEGEGGSDASYEGEGLIELLAHRLSHVAHRMFRDAQVRSCIHPQSPMKVARYAHVCINQDHFHDSERNPCGILPGSMMSVQAGLHFLQQPAHKHPACDCTADPHPV